MQRLLANGRDNLHNGGLGHILGENLAKLRNAVWHHGLSLWGDLRCRVFKGNESDEPTEINITKPNRRLIIFIPIPIMLCCCARTESA